jgi:hypothetical protein
MKNIKKNTWIIFYDVILGTDDLDIYHEKYYLIFVQCSQALKKPVERASIELFDRMKIALTQS